ncbi:hypothetical protein KEJ52_06505 [Candidatus Bathyarchaeota archaeon]|nr:hypothetical protein [Candidatus Bathyarchaeota archaeon]
MGFSVTITSSIILIAMFTLSTSFLVAAFQNLKDISQIAEQYISREREKLDVALQLEIKFLNATVCMFILKNAGSRTVFFKDQTGFRWNTVIVSYESNSFWASYEIEDYTVLEVKVSNSSYTFPPEKHPYVDAGEEALILFSLPKGAPEIPINGLVSVVFVSHYGVTAKAEAVRTQ